MQRRTVLDRIAFVLASSVVMVILHGNSRQFWPRIPWLSLRDESVGEHTRLVFNTLALVTLGQAALGRLPPGRRLARGVVLAAIPAALPALIWFGQQGLRLQGKRAETYNLALVPILPISAVVVEDVIASAIGTP